MLTGLMIRPTSKVTEIFGSGRLWTQDLFLTDTYYLSILLSICIFELVLLTDVVDELIQCMYFTFILLFYFT